MSLSPAISRSGTAVTASVGGERRSRSELSLPLPLNRWVADRAYWEMEIGFGKGRYLLQRALDSPESGFVGIEVASRYFRLAERRAGRRGLSNVVLLHGEAIYLMTTHLPTSFARAVHVYFPDPWPKSRHHKRRLFDPETVDLVLRLLKVGGYLFFASDHTEYGDSVRELLTSHPAVEVVSFDEGWPEGPRTNYEAKYVREGRRIVRLRAQRLASDAESLLHPAGRAGLLVAADQSTSQPSSDAATSDLTDG